MAPWFLVALFSIIFVRSHKFESNNNIYFEMLFCETDFAFNRNTDINRGLVGMRLHINSEQ